MLETLINPKKAERRPWEMFFVGLLYAAVSVLIADFIFLKNPALSKYTSIFIVMFVVMFSIPFFFYMIRIEEKKDLNIKSEKKLIKEHGKAIFSLLFLFLGYVASFSILFVVMPLDTTNENFRAQIETYCLINNGYDFQKCVDSHITTNAVDFGEKTSGSVIKEGMNRISSILSNNFYVLIFSLLLSFLFGAGAIFILIWNASVIATAIGIFSKAGLAYLPQNMARFMIHGLPEISSYFIVALAGGIIGTAIIKHDFGHEKFWKVLQDSLSLIVLALVVLIFAAFIEVFITPVLF